MVIYSTKCYDCGITIYQTTKGIYVCNKCKTNSTTEKAIELLIELKPKKG